MFTSQGSYGGFGIVDGFGGRLGPQDDMISFAKSKTLEKCGLVTKTLDHVATIQVHYFQATWYEYLAFSRIFQGGDYVSVPSARWKDG